MGGVGLDDRDVGLIARGWHDAVGGQFTSHFMDECAEDICNISTVSPWCLKAESHRLLRNPTVTLWYWRSLFNIQLNQVFSDSNNEFKRDLFQLKTCEEQQHLTLRCHRGSSRLFAHNHRWFCLSAFTNNVINGSRQLFFLFKKPPWRAQIKPTAEIPARQQTADRVKKKKAEQSS